MLTTLYADRLASEGIFVHEVRPGVIATDMTSTVTEKYDQLIKEGTLPDRTLGKPEDVQMLSVHFAVINSNIQTGNYIDVDGGFHISRL